jgi:hypothetical protein
MTYISGILRSIYFANSSEREKRREHHGRNEERNMYGELVVLGKRNNCNRYYDEDLLDIEDEVTD